MPGENQTIYYLISMLKQYNLHYIVASPGMQNARFNSIVQQEECFKCFSVVDERSALYFATGIAAESGEPVVVTCTGATASRNYLSGLTEAFYRKIPIIAITFFNYSQCAHSLSPQYVNRKNIAPDIAYESVDLPRITDQIDKTKLLSLINAALYKAFYQNLPVHINCPSSFVFGEESCNNCSDIWSPQYYNNDFQNLSKELQTKRFAVFVGSHHKFSESETQALSDFAKSYDIPVLCDHTSNYRGRNKVLISKLVNQLKNLKKPELLIDMGEICGEYSATTLFAEVKIWRISENGEFKCRNNKPVAKMFDCREEYFFRQLCSNKTVKGGYYTEIRNKLDEIADMKLPLSNAMVCKHLAASIPAGSSLHLAILNSLRCMNFFELDNSIDVNANVGGFGIDGCLSTIAGQSVVNKDKLCFAVIGDLAFFYDMNILGVRHLGKNLRIILVNNNRGEEFRLNPTLENRLGTATDQLIAAAGHYNGNEVSAAENWAKACGFCYMSAKTEEEFTAQIEKFCGAGSDKPVLFEVFTTDKNEKAGLNMLKNPTLCKAEPVNFFKRLFTKENS